MAIITLTTDFGLRDYFVATLKGRLSAMSNIQLVDISHEINPFHIAEAAYVLKNAYPYFPEGTVHVVGVDALPHQEFIAARFDNHYFICANNGFLSLITEEKDADEVVSLKPPFSYIDQIFPTRDLFLPVALELCQGKALSSLGTKTKEVKEAALLNPIIKNNRITGSVLYIDRFGNVVFNISKAFFEKVVGDKPFNILLRGQSFSTIHKSYTGIVSNPENESQYHGKGMALFNDANYLEIAIYKSKPDSFGSAKSLYRLNYGDTIIIDCKL